MFGLLACSEVYEFGQLGTMLFWLHTVPKPDDFFLKEPTTFLRGDPELQPKSSSRSSRNSLFSLTNVA